MKARTTILTLLIAVVVMIAMSAACYAESLPPFKGECSFDGKEITGNFDEKEIDAAVENLEPGDDLTYLITYKNDSDETTNWYMKNDVIKTLEESKDPAENGGYTYVLQNIDPNGKEETPLFDNSEVGGDAKVADLEGLKQATNATGEYFFIQKLEPGQSAQTKIKVGFDGETEVNDYMDTSGALTAQYAVEVADNNNNNRTTHTYNTTNNTNNHTNRVVRTGDLTNLILPIVLLVCAAVAIVITIISWRRTRRREDGDQA